MRTIKFRGQDIASNKWLFGDIRHHRNDVCIFEQGGHIGEQVKPDTIGQFTGLTDKDGKEIYEGDILLWTRKNVHIEGRPRQDFSDKCVVYYDNDKNGWNWPNIALWLDVEVPDELEQITDKWFEENEQR